MSEKLFKILAWSTLAFIIFATVSPIGLRPHDVLPVNVDRALAFALLSCLFVVAYPRYFLISTAFIIASAFAIELLQYLQPTRHPEVRDALIKAAGAAFGLLAGWLINRYRTSRPL
ncbi:VanZ family protein [Rhizobium rhizoryzae]|uniref:VanZ family protein n=1 Tax=Rhizobium rhizoryzae TaxID=451876 RepID=A0A7W6LGL3_9HYPH|nr:VanZ family protein [Rhizobium rhizoryzae]MBB4142943.1 VanZ family protein [Rhizobium rhizoryzae]